MVWIRQTDGRFSGSNHRHALAVDGVAADGPLDGAAADYLPLHQGQVLALDLAGLQGGRQVGVGLQGLGHHQQAAGLFVQTMHYAAPG